jgi:hypothetical protein
MDSVTSELLLDMQRTAETVLTQKQQVRCHSGANCRPESSSIGILTDLDHYMM